MPRPKRKRLIHQPPIMEGFKPFGVPITEMEPVVLFFEEYESIRLLDYQGLTQLEAAYTMHVSRPTLTRIYEKARKTVAEAFIEGKPIFIAGGDYHTTEWWYRCEHCHQLIISEGEMQVCQYCNSISIKPLSKKNTVMDHQENVKGSGYCICLKCDIKVPHQLGKPCRETECPQCGKKMIRENSYHHQLYLKKKGKL